MSTEHPLSSQTLRELQPIGSLSSARLDELAKVCYVERVGRQLDPFRVQPLKGKTVYLLSGELALAQHDGGAYVLVGGSEEARFPIGRRIPFISARAITDVELVRFDDELIDIMATWDQLAEVEVKDEPSEPEQVSPHVRDWRLMTGFFSIKNLKHGNFARLPPGQIATLMTRFERLDVRRGEVVVREGSEPDYYYVLETGRAQVTRHVGGVEMKLAQMKAGDAFGEESLLSGGKRNASVTMLADGTLLRLPRLDFEEYLKKPLLKIIARTDAEQKVAEGGQWIDVRYPSEYHFDKLSGALNIPLAEIRNAAGILDPQREYIFYCQTGRRSAAAAFLLAQRGFKAYALAGGLAAD
jgi:rhodanese-related sulfurtransferase